MATIWDSFRADPRKPQNRSLLASDADRDVLLAALAEAHVDGRLTAAEHEQRVGAVLAVRTLGELPPFVTDLLTADERATRTALTTPPPAEMMAVGNETWRVAMRKSLGVFVAVAAVSLVLWLLLSAPGLFWPIFPIAVSGLNVGWVFARRAAIAENRARQLQRRAEQGLPPA